MYPAAYHACSDGTYKTWESRAVSRCFFSDDNGQSWAPASNDIGLELETNSGMQEPGIVQKTDGSILLWARTDLGKQYCSLSSDNGLSWSKARPSKLKSPLSPATIKQMPWDGRLLAVWNDHGGIHPYMLGRRTPLSVAVSADGGKSWSKSKCIESELSGWYCYTAMEFLENKVLLAYCAGDTRVGLLNRTKVVSIERAFFDTM